MIISRVSRAVAGVAVAVAVLGAIPALTLPAKASVTADALSDRPVVAAADAGDASAAADDAAVGTGSPDGGSAVISLMDTSW